jgi:hypothetical protein
VVAVVLAAGVLVGMKINCAALGVFHSQTSSWRFLGAAPLLRVDKKEECVGNIKGLAKKIIFFAWSRRLEVCGSTTQQHF